MGVSAPILVRSFVAMESRLGSGVGEPSIYVASSDAGTRAAGTVFSAIVSGTYG